MRFAACRQAWQAAFDVDAAVGIGLHRGEVASGVFDVRAAERHLLVGDAANLAVRLGRRARAGEIILSDDVGLPYLTWAAAAHPPAELGAGKTAPLIQLPLIQLPPLQLSRGRDPLTIWCIPAPQRLIMRGARQERQP